MNDGADSNADDADNNADDADDALLM